MLHHWCWTDVLISAWRLNSVSMLRTIIFFYVYGSFYRFFSDIFMHLLSRLTTRTLNTLDANPFFTLWIKIKINQTGYFLLNKAEWWNNNLEPHWLIVPSRPSDPANQAPRRCQWVQANLRCPAGGLHFVCVCVYQTGSATEKKTKKPERKACK